MAAALLSPHPSLPSPNSRSSLRPRHALAQSHDSQLTAHSRKLHTHPPLLGCAPDSWLVPGDCAGAGARSAREQRAFHYRGGGSVCSPRALASLLPGTAGWRWKGGAFSSPGSCLLSQSHSQFQVGITGCVRSCGCMVT